MANAIATNGTHKRKETYANEVLTIARSEMNIYEDFSTDYEVDGATGQIMVPTRDGEVELSDYDILNGIELKQSVTDYLPLPIDQNYACNELIDGYEADAVPDNIRAQRIESAGYSFGMKKEGLAIEALKKGTISSDKAPLTKEDAYEKIATEIKNMKKRNMKVASMRVVVSAETELLLLTDEKFANTAGSLGEQLVREGVIGKINGVPVKPNYLMGDDVEFIIYDKRFCQKYENWAVEPTINNISDGKHIGASALQGRQVGGLMVTNSLGVQVKKSE
nr:MAG TPA: major capsid protein [Caudoviricetes sp.]